MLAENLRYAKPAPALPKPVAQPLKRATPAAQPGATQTQPAGTPPPGNIGAGPGAPPGSPWDSDPVLQQIRAQTQANIANAQAQALASRQKSLIQFGYDPVLASLYGDAATTEAAKNNPFSTLAQLAHA